MSYFNYSVEKSNSILSHHDKNQNQFYQVYQNGHFDRFGYFNNAVGIRAHNVEDQRACHLMCEKSYGVTLNKTVDF